MASLRSPQAELSAVFPGHPFDLAQGRIFQLFFIQAHRIMFDLKGPGCRTVGTENNHSAAVKEINRNGVCLFATDIHQDIGSGSGIRSLILASKRLLGLVQDRIRVPYRQKRAGGQAGDCKNTENNYNFSHYDMNFGETIIKELQKII